MVWDDTKIDDEGLTPAGRLLASEYNDLVTAVKARVLESLFDANTILKADSDDTPAALTVDEQRLVGRITAGVITGLSAAQVKTLLSLDEVVNIKVNLIATVAPTVNEDSGDGYSVLSRWADITADKEYVCLDATVAAAVWVETTSVGDVSSDSIWDAAGDLVVGTGADTAARLGLGTALQLIRVNAGATGLEYVTLGAGGIAAESFSTSPAHLTTDQDAGKAFTIASFPTHAQVKKIRIRADFTAGQQSNTGTALVNNGSGILPAGTSIVYDGDSPTDLFAVDDQILIDSEWMDVTAVDTGTNTLTVTRGIKGTVAAFHDDNSVITKGNHGIRLVLFRDSNKLWAERIIELSTMMTYSGTTDAAITATDDYFGLTADIQNVGSGDFIVIEDTADEVCKVQNVNHDTVSATYDFTIFVKDDLAAHGTTKVVNKLIVYDLDTPYSSGAGTLYGTVYIDEKIASTVNVTIEIDTDSYT